MAEVHGEIDAGNPSNLSFVTLGDFQAAPPRFWATQYTDIVLVDQFINRFLKRHDPCFGTDPLTLERVESVKRLLASEFSSIRAGLSILKTVLGLLLISRAAVVDGERELYFVY
jgi:hypothetical protein